MANGPIQPAQLFLFGRPTTGTPIQSEEVRNNFDALGQLNRTNNEDFPEIKKDGMPRVLTLDPNNVKLQVWFDNAWRTLIQKIQLGIPAPAKVEFSFNPSPGPPPIVWNIDHNLGSKPLVQVFDLAANQLELVKHFPSTQQMVARLSALSLGAVGAGPPVPVRVGVPLPFNGALVSALVVIDESVVGATFTVDFAISGTPVVGGTVSVAPGPPFVTVPGAPITGANTFAAGSTLDVLVTTPAPITAGAIDVYLVFQRTLNAEQYTLIHSTDNRVVITHPGPTAGFAIILG